MVREIAALRTSGRQGYTPLLAIMEFDVPKVARTTSLPRDRPNRIPSGEGVAVSATRR